MVPADRGAGEATLILQCPCCRSAGPVALLSARRLPQCPQNSGMKAHHQNVSKCHLFIPNKLVSRHSGWGATNSEAEN